MPEIERQDTQDAFQERLKKGFDRQIVKEYIAEFKSRQLRADGTPMPDHALWADLAEQLCLSYHAARRYSKGIDKRDQRPVSLLDGQAERYEPGFEEVFRYIAAKDLLVEFSRGRAIVNRATARALNGIRKAYPGPVSRIAPHEVERLCFLREWKGPFSIKTAEAMRQSPFHDLMGQVDCNDAFVNELGDLFREWNLFYSDFAEALPYPWVK